MIVQCRYCQTSIELNLDTRETREAGTDPHQQLRRHIEAQHLGKVAEHSRRAGWLQDQLFFTCPADPERWRANMIDTLDWLISYQATPKAKPIGI